jgi:hypothetical protein
MAGKTAILSLRILADAKEAQKALDDTAGSADKFQAGVSKAAVPAAAALGVLAAAGISAAKAAAEDQASADQLAVALRNSTGATKSQIAATEEWISKTSKSAAVADDELRPALATLARATGDTAESQKAMGVALDVSAATGKDVESVSAALAKAYAGQTTSLGKLVPGMDKAILASGDMDAIMAELARTTGGAAAAAANSAAGKWKGFQIQMGEAQEAIGGALLPLMTRLGGSLAGVAEWVGRNTTLFLVLGGAIAAIASAILVVNVALKAYAAVQAIITAATKAWAAVQWVLNAAMAANPLGLVVIAIIAIIAAIALLWTKNEAFREAVIGAWDAIRNAAAVAWDWIVNAVKAAWNFIVSIGRAYVAVYVAIWNGIKAAAAAVWNWIVAAASTMWNAVVALARTYINIYVSIFQGIKAAVGAVWDWLQRTAGDALAAILRPVNAIRDAFDNVVSAIKRVIEWLGRIKIPDVLGSIGNAIGGLFSAPAAAASRSTGTAFSGTAGLSTFGAPSLSASASSSRGAPQIVVQGALDPVAVARQIRQILTTDDRRRGGVVIA